MNSPDWYPTTGQVKINFYLNHRSSGKRLTASCCIVVHVELRDGAQIVEEPNVIESRSVITALAIPFTKLTPFAALMPWPLIPIYFVVTWLLW